MHSGLSVALQLFSLHSKWALAIRRKRRISFTFFSCSRLCSLVHVHQIKHGAASFRLVLSSLGNCKVKSSSDSGTCPRSFKINKKSQLWTHFFPFFHQHIDFSSISFRSNNVYDPIFNIVQNQTVTKNHHKSLGFAILSLFLRTFWDYGVVIFSRFALVAAGISLFKQKEVKYYWKQLINEYHQRKHDINIEWANILVRLKFPKHSSP